MGCGKAEDILISRNGEGKLKIETNVRTSSAPIQNDNNEEHSGTGQ